MTQIICAIDTADLQEAKRLILMLAPYIDIVKLGLEFFCSLGFKGVQEIAKLNKPIFLDLKLNDIPNTVIKTLKILKNLPIAMLTVHVLGGEKMLQGSKAALEDSKIKLIGVTLLTSLSDQDLKKFNIISLKSHTESPKKEELENNIGLNIENYVKNLAIFGKNNGLDGVVCSLAETNIIKEYCGAEFITVTPGIIIKESLRKKQNPQCEGQNNNFNNSKNEHYQPYDNYANYANYDRYNDHKRAVNISELKNFSYNPDYIVVGRAITAAENPLDKAKYLYSQLHSTS